MLVIRLCACAALVALAVAQTSPGPHFAEYTSTRRRLQINARQMWGPVAATVGYSGESTIQAAAQFYGSWLPTHHIRAAASTGGVSAVDISNTSFTTATSYFQLATFPFTYNSSVTAAESEHFDTFVTTQIDQGNPVAVGMYIRMPAGTGGALYDRIVLITGYESNATHAVAGLWFIDWYSAAPRLLTAPYNFSRTNFETSASSVAPPPANDFAVPVSNIKAYAFVGITDATGTNVAQPVLNVTMPNGLEPDTTLGAAPVNVTINGWVVGLTQYSFYTIMRFEGNASIPTGPFASRTDAVASYYFEAFGPTIALPTQLGSVLSNQTVIFRVVESSPPAYTPVPPAQVLPSDSCSIPASSIYSLDASAVACVALRDCRAAYCACLNVGDGNNCWMRSTVECRKHQSCINVASQCIEMVASSSTEASCATLTQLYNKSAPVIPNLEREYLNSALGQQCHAFACNVYRGLLNYNRAPCTLDYNQVCDMTALRHLILRLSGPSFDMLMRDWRFEDAVTVSLAADLSTLFTPYSATVLAVESLGNVLNVHFRLQQTDSNTNLTVPLLAGNNNSAWLSSTSATYSTTWGGTGALAVVALYEKNALQQSTSLLALLQNCDNTCVVLASVFGLFFIIFVMVIFACCRLYVCSSDEELDADVGGLAGSIRQVLERRKEKKAHKRAAEQEEGEANDDEHEPINE